MKKQQQKFECEKNSKIQNSIKVEMDKITVTVEVVITYLGIFSLPGRLKIKKIIYNFTITTVRVDINGKVVFLPIENE